MEENFTQEISRSISSRTKDFLLANKNIDKADFSKGKKMKKLTISSNTIKPIDERTKIGKKKVKIN